MLWHIRWFINSADLMFDRSALFGLSNQLSFNVPVAGSESNIKTAQYSSDGKAVDKDLRVAGSNPAQTPLKGDMFIGFLRRDDLFSSNRNYLGGVSLFAALLFCLAAYGYRSLKVVLLNLNLQIRYNFELLK